MKFELEIYNRNTDEKELLEDLRKIHNSLKYEGQTLTYRSYNELGKYSSSTISTRFGTWNDAIVKAGLEVNEEKEISDKDLFLNIEAIWISLGRQPVTRDLIKPQSKYSAQTYSERFGGWRNSLEAFVTYINEAETPNIEDPVTDEKNTLKAKGKKKRRTSRNVSDRLRFSILMRDGFTCQSCGASPTKKRGVELHVDHILPWSKGGETVESNLQAKCKQCNLGKGNAFNK